MVVVNSNSTKLSAIVRKKVYVVDHIKRDASGDSATVDIIMVGI